MTFSSRSIRSDRRRRVMREAVAADGGVAVESLRVRRRREQERDQLDEDDNTSRRDPGYSQAVRRACQQRLVQLIPVRTSSLWLVIFGMWGLWATLLAAHYWIHIRSAATAAQWPVSYLLHIRSTHGIAHWLGSQLWLLTALAALMIFQLRKHKLDDYRARYRVWAFLSIAALVSSLDVSSSGLYLLGKSVDPWTQRELGYSGWKVVLASFAAIVGVLGLRLCGELKSAPLSVLFWLGGLVSWAASAVLGTDLVVSPWSPDVTNLVVGATWLGGILAVALSAGIYLRYVYIEAQKRFVIRNRLIRQKQGWKVPKLTWRRRDREDLPDSVEEQSMASERRSRKATSEKIDDDEYDSENSRDESSRDELAKRRRFGLPSFGMSWGRRKDSDFESTDTEKDYQSKSRNKSTSSSKEAVSKDSRSSSEEPSNSEERRSWLRVPKVRLPRWRSDPKLGEDYSDVDAEQRLRDSGYKEPMTKKSGWFGKRSKTESEPATTQAANTQRYSSATIASDSDESKPTPTKKGWFQRKPKVAKESTRVPSDKKKTSWTGWKRKKSDEGSIDAKPQPAAKATADRRRWFGFLDGLKLKPPVESSGAVEPKKVGTQPSGLPSSSASQRYDSKPPATSSGSSPFRPAQDDEDDDSDYRNLSKAERKRLRRQQQQDRRAA